MANYSLVINSRFRPFEYQELLAPALMATQAHQAVEEAYADLSTKASIWDKMANEATDPKAHAMYKKYADDLQSYSDKLAQYGLTPTSRQAMLNMRSRYAQDIVPIENAYKRKQAQMEEQRKALLQNPTLLLSRRAANTSLDDYLDNPDLDYESYSGALITQQVASAAANIAKEARDSEEGRRKLRQILPYQYEMVQQRGFSREAVMEAIMNSPNADRVLTGLVEDAIGTSGVKNWGDTTTLARAYDYARQGLYSAIGETNYQMLTDQAGLTRLQYDLQDRNNARQAQRSEQAAIRAAQRAQQQKDQEFAQNIALSGQSYLVASGKDKEYLQTLQGLRAGENGVRASVFGKHGTVNAMKVYDEYRRAGKSTLTPAQLREADERAEATAMQKWEKSWGKRENIAPQQRGIAAQQLENIRAREKAAEYTRVAQAAVLKKYGVSQVLTTDQYNTLKALGYNGERTTSMDQFTAAVNNLSQERTYYSTNMSGYNIPDQKIRSALGNWETNGSFSGRVYRLNADGTRGKAMSYSDLNLKSEDNDKGRQITGIYYSDVTPTKIIVQLGDGTGDRYLVDPNALGSEVQSFITNSRTALQNVSSTERAQTITVGLANLLNSYNPTLSTTSSKE